MAMVPETSSSSQGRVPGAAAPNSTSVINMPLGIGRSADIPESSEDTQIGLGHNNVSNAGIRDSMEPQATATRHVRSTSDDKQGRLLFHPTATISRHHARQNTTAVNAMRGAKRTLEEVKQEQEEIFKGITCMISSAKAAIKPKVGLTSRL